jgi:hypothetical protein
MNEKWAVHIPLHTHTYIHTHMHIPYLYICTHIHIYFYTHLHIDTHIGTYTFSSLSAVEYYEPITLFLKVELAYGKCTLHIPLQPTLKRLGLLISFAQVIWFSLVFQRRKAFTVLPRRSLIYTHTDTCFTCWFPILDNFTFIVENSPTNWVGSFHFLQGETDAQRYKLACPGKTVAVLGLATQASWGLTFIGCSLVSWPNSASHKHCS